MYRWTSVLYIFKHGSQIFLQNVKIDGFGGTILQPGLDMFRENFKHHGLLVLTDGYCDSLNFSGYKGKVLIISNGVEVPIQQSNGKIRQIIVEEDRD